MKIHLIINLIIYKKNVRFIAWSKLKINIEEWRFKNWIKLE